MVGRIPRAEKFHSIIALKNQGIFWKTHILYLIDVDYVCGMIEIGNLQKDQARAIALAQLQDIIDFYYRSSDRIRTTDYKRVFLKWRS
jgi:hypothetical protein